MADFDLFDKLNELTISETVKKVEISTCPHINVTESGGFHMCTDCGEETKQIISQEKEWRFYGAADSKHNSDPNRCQARKNEEKTIFKDVENMEFSDKIVSVANTIYTQVTNGKIYRGFSRKAIIFACIFHAYKLSGTPQMCDTLIAIFGLDKKTGQKGLKHVNLKAPKSLLIHTTYITPANLVEEIMDKFSATQDQKDEVINLYEQIKNRSSKLNRSRPQSVAAGLTYYWIRKNNKNITIKEFVTNVNLSELTVSKIYKAIEEILN